MIALCFGMRASNSSVDTRQTGRNLTTGHVDTAGVEGTHRQLRAGLTDGLSGDDADRLTHTDELARAGLMP